jgi:hypothetical protein
MTSHRIKARQLTSGAHQRFLLGFNTALYNLTGSDHDKRLSDIPVATRGRSCDLAWIRQAQYQPRENRSETYTALSQGIHKQYSSRLKKAHA